MNNILLTAGVVCLISAVVGGGLKAFNVEIPLFSSVKRQVILGLVGLSFLTLTFYDRQYPPRKNENDANAPVAANTGDGVAESVDQPHSGNVLDAVASDRSDGDGGSDEQRVSTEGYIYLGMRSQNKWVNNDHSPVDIIDTDLIPREGSTVTINGSVNLRRSFPSEQAPMTMPAKLGVLTPGTRVKIVSVRYIASEYYWAQVQVSHDRSE